MFALRYSWSGRFLRVAVGSGEGGGHRVMGSRPSRFTASSRTESYGPRATARAIRWTPSTSEGES